MGNSLNVKITQLAYLDAFDIAPHDHSLSEFHTDTLNKLPALVEE